MDRRPIAADMHVGADRGVCAPRGRRGGADRHQPGRDDRTRGNDCENLGARYCPAKQDSRSKFRSGCAWLGRSASMAVGILVIVWVLVLRSVYQKKLLEDQQKDATVVLESIQNALSLAEVKYRVGQTDLSPVLQLENVVSSTQMASTSIQLELIANRINLYLALGGAF